MFLSDWFKKWDEPRSSPVEEYLKILVLCTSLEDRFLLERLGKRHGWDLWFVESARAGFRLVSENAFDVILCDRNQPGYPWREVVDRLTTSSPRSCVMLISPMKDDYLWGEVILHGGYDVVSRPLREDSLLRVIQAAVRYLAPPPTVPSASG